MSDFVVRELTLTEEEILAGRGIQKKVNGRDVVIPQLSLSRLTRLSLDLVEVMRGFATESLTNLQLIEQAPPKFFELIGNVLGQPGEFVGELSVRQIHMLIEDLLLLNGYEGGLKSFFVLTASLWNQPLVPSTISSRSSTNGENPTLTD